MKILVVKTSSFGDILHAFPALTDARRHVDGLVCDWVVERPFAAMPAWHPAVRETITVSMRGWRRPPWLNHLPDIIHSVRRLRRERYDMVIDAQGLMKSAFLTRLARGERVGLGVGSAREASAARVYQRTVEPVAPTHAIERVRRLFAVALDYKPAAEPDFGLAIPPAPPSATSVPEAPYLVFIPGTTWPSKRWPLRYWRELAGLTADAGWPVRIVAGSESERRDAEEIAANIDGVEAFPPLTLDGLARALAAATAAVAVDTGPAHLAAAVGAPGVSIYGATDPTLTGVRGPRQRHLRAEFPCAPCLTRQCRFADRGQVYPDCYASVPPLKVWSTLYELIHAS